MIRYAQAHINHLQESTSMSIYARHSHTRPSVAQAIVLSSVMALTLGLSMPATNAFAATSSEIKSELSTARKKRDSLYSQAEQASEDLNAAQDNLDKTNASIASTQKDIDAKEQDVRNARSQLATNFRNEYKGNSVSSVLSMIADASSISDMTKAVANATQITTDTNSKIANVQGQERDLQKSMDKLKTLQSQQQEQVATCQSKKSDMDAKVKDADDYVNGLSSDLKQAIAQEDAEASAKAAAAAASVVTTATTDSPSDATTSTATNTAGLADWQKTVIAAAESQLGGRYVYGGTAFRATDCSGLVMQCYAKVGKSLPHNSEADMSLYCHKSISQVQPGDIVWHPGHVGIYIGNGVTIEAMNPSRGITYGTIKSFSRCGSPFD